MRVVLTVCLACAVQAYLKHKMEQQFQAQQAGLLSRLAQLEAWSGSCWGGVLEGRILEVSTARHGRPQHV